TTQIPTTEAEWRVRLNPEEFRVLRQAGTEAPWTGEYVSTRTPGMYHCRACGAELFASDTKFDSHCGWPSLYDAVPGTVKLDEDGEVVAYLRILVDGDGVDRIGRVCTAKTARGGGRAGILMRAALDAIGDRPCVLDAQSYLAAWYASFGFTPNGPEFIEDGI